MSSLWNKSFFLMLSLLAALSPALAHAQQGGTGMNYETRLSALEDELRGQAGRIEQLENTIRRLDQTMQRMQGDIDARLSRMETTAAPSQPAPTPQPAAPQQPAAQQPVQQPPVPAADVDTNGTLGSLKMQNGKVTGGAVKPQSPPLPDTPADYGLTPQEQYDRAFGLLRQADYEGAETAFKSFIDKNPKDKLLDNAKYWYGETLYVRGKFDESSVAFAEAYQQNPQGTKAPDSLLKLAMSLGNLSKKDDACTTLGELKKNYPKASATIKSRAGEEASKLKCPAQ